MSEPEACNSRNIPEPIKQAVRRRCGFGCVVCGLPLYEYEHLLGWANVRRHVAEEITLLCDKHHREKTAGLMPIEVVARADSMPFNLRTGVSKPYTLHYEGPECEIRLGSCSFSMRDNGAGATMAPLVIDGLALLGFELFDSHLLLSLHLFDEDNSEILHISRNQLVYSPEPWDIRLVRRTLSIRAGKGRYLLEVAFSPPSTLRINRARFHRNGVEVSVSPRYFLIVNSRNLLLDLHFKNYPVGLAIGAAADTLPAAILINDVPRPVTDRAEILKWANRQERRMSGKQ